MARNDGTQFKIAVGNLDLVNLGQFGDPAEQERHLVGVSIDEGEAHAVAGDGMDDSRPRFEGRLAPFDTQVKDGFWLLRVYGAEIATAAADYRNGSEHAPSTERLDGFGGSKNRIARSLARVRVTLTCGYGML